MKINDEWLSRLFALLYIGAMFSLIFLYVREFPTLGNTMGMGRLAAYSVGCVATLCGVVLWKLRHRLTPLARHWPEIVFSIFPALFFAPLAGSLVNRLSQTTENQPFIFISETPFYASGYGVLKGESLQPSGYRLKVRYKNGEKMFKYKQQAYFPLTQPGDTILLPVSRGWLGFSTMVLP